MIQRKVLNFKGFGSKNYFEPVRNGNAFSNNYIEYKSEGDRNRPYLSNMINDFKTKALINSIYVSN